MSLEVDYIVVGAGSAGCVMANRLAEHHSVLLLEAGTQAWRWDFRLHMPAALSEVLATDRYNWFYHSEPEPHLNQRRMYCPRGKVLGGSSAINGMIFVRGHRLDYQRWAENAGLAGWSYQDCLPFFKKSETVAGQDLDYRGDSGPLNITRGDVSNPLYQAWLTAGVEMGQNRTDDFNGVQQEGFGLFDRTIFKGMRQSTAVAYLRSAKISSQECQAGLTIMTRSVVQEILFDQDQAVGVKIKRQGELVQARARKEVLLCGGAINSPQLLMLSGIGQADELRSQSIDCRVELPGVGKNLQDHLEVYVQYSLKKPVSLYPVSKWYRKPWVGLQWYLNQSGPAASNHFHTGAFLRSGLDQGYPDLQFHFLPIAMDYDGKNQFQGHGLQVHVGPMKPTSRGSVSLRSDNPQDSPYIRFNYHATEQDREVMYRGIRQARDIMAQPAFAPYVDREIRPGPGLDNLDAFVREFAESAYHPSGSCRMGDDAMAVVDASGRVRGVSGLRVVDASIMPEITNGNLNAVVIMMAEKISHEILNGENSR
jgi:choline dehydrogenase